MTTYLSCIKANLIRTAIILIGDHVSMMDGLHNNPRWRLDGGDAPHLADQHVPILVAKRSEMMSVSKEFHSNENEWDST